MLGVLTATACETAQPVAATGSKLETSIGLTMIAVAAGEFWIGSPESEAGRDGDEPRHRVRFTKAYWLGETEVTQGQWRAVMGTEPWKGNPYLREGDAVAATCVSHVDAREFCRKLTEREMAAGRLPEGYRFVLPTEAEWESAARAGTETAFPFGADGSLMPEYAVYPAAREGEYPHAVKSRKPNAWGFHDLNGNVWEWCADFANWADKVVTDSYRDGIVDPLCQSGRLRIRRGGSWYHPAAGSRSADRECSSPDHADFSFGFRPALAARSDVE